MGFDIYGQKFKNKKGEYFRNNVWWWRRLWQFTVTHCPFLTEKEIFNGTMNNSAKIVLPKADKIAKVLKETIKNGEALKYEKEVKAVIKKAKANNKKLKCGDKNYDWNESYPFTVENLKEFIEFVENSGGFRIC